MKAAERESFNQQLKSSAFVSWRLEVALGSLFGGQVKVSYPDYCERMGLLTQKEIKQNAALKKLQQLQDKQIVEEAKLRADEIMRIDKANRAKAMAEKEGG